MDTARISQLEQGYLAHKKPPFLRTLQYGFAQGPMVLLGGGRNARCVHVDSPRSLKGGRPVSGGNLTSAFSPVQSNAMPYAICRVIRNAGNRFHAGARSSALHPCGANMAEIRQSRSDSGLGFQVKVIRNIPLRSEAARLSKHRSLPASVTVLLRSLPV